MRRRVEKKCAATSVAADTLFPGVCARPTLQEAEQCVIAKARCHGCFAVASSDAQNLDCDKADNQLQDSSCQ
jgi:hypothetical protein